MKTSGALLFLHLLLITPPQKNLVLSQSFSNDTQSRIVGGYSCDIRNIPFMVAIYTRQMCGGSLLTYSWVLTAGHCVKPKNLEGMETSAVLRAGYNADPNLVQSRYIKRAIMHPNFRPELLKGDQELRYDIALIEVKQPFLPSPVAQLAKLPQKGFASRCPTVLAAGTGLTESNEDIGRDINVIFARPLLCVELKAYYDINFCQKWFPKANMDQTLFCASDSGKDTCSGDSGGPIICEGIVVGIVSYGPKICGTGVATYTKVEEYLDFIKSYVIEKRSTTRSESIKNSAQKNTAHKNALFLTVILALLLY